MRHLVKRNPYFPTFNHVIDDIFGDISKTWGVENTKTVPAVNITEEENSFQLEVAAPGLSKEDFNIELENGKLVISASQEGKSEENAKNFKRKEYSYTSFSRAFELPETIDVLNIEANYTNGILGIRLPKKEEETQKNHKIEIK